MIATLHLPGVSPRVLTATELTALNLSQSLQPRNEELLRGLLGTAIPGEVLASGPNYFVVSVENAADYDFEPTPSATRDFERLTGVAVEEDEPLLGPLLIIEA
jgi:hypothetical protein